MRLRRICITNLSEVVLFAARVRSGQGEGLTGEEPGCMIRSSRAGFPERSSSSAL